MPASTTPTEPITNAMIETLHSEAVAEDDDEMADTCVDACDNRIDRAWRNICRWFCASVINADRAADESTPYVRVVGPQS